MAFSLDQVVPWGRNLSEYCAMFALSDADLQRSILGCGDGPASFNTELSQRGGTVLSLDPIYQFSASEIASRIEQTREVVMQQVRENHDQFVWKQIRDPEHLEQIRLQAMQQFLRDYRDHPERYLAAELPHSGLPDQAFDLALCSHFLFLYSAQLTAEFHLQAIAELCRVAREIRIFPIRDLSGDLSPHLSAVKAFIEAQQWHWQIDTVDYEFQRGATQMFKITTT